MVGTVMHRVLTLPWRGDIGSARIAEHFSILHNAHSNLVGTAFKANHHGHSLLDNQNKRGRVVLSPFSETQYWPNMVWSLAYGPKHWRQQNTTHKREWKKDAGVISHFIKR